MKELRISPIKNGTVIDHIKPGMALKILPLLSIDQEFDTGLSIAMNAHSEKHGKKDIVKIEDKELHPREVNRLAVITPNASISIIRDFKVVKKYKVRLPDTIEGIVRCENLNCITNGKEPIKSRLIKIQKDPVKFRCYYCGRIQNRIEKRII